MAQISGTVAQGVVPIATVEPASNDESLQDSASEILEGSDWLSKLQAATGLNIGCLNTSSDRG